MKIKVLLFAQLKEIYGTDSFDMQLPEHSRISDAVFVLMNQDKMKRLDGLPLRFAVNECFEETGKFLKEGDELAVLSPVAGG